jgi:hypothetical protein
MINSSLDYGLDGLEVGFDFRQGKNIFLFSITPRPVLGPTQPLIQ